MRVNRIAEKTYAEGPDCRFCIWVQGCNHHCDGCFATELWDFNKGCAVSRDEIISMIESVSDDICGVTFLGGEPFEYASELSKIAQYTHEAGKSVITFTGYTYEYLAKNEQYRPLLDETDVLIDGRFEKSLIDYSRPLVGSSNQRFIYLTNRISQNEMMNYKNRFEIKISKDGNAVINGMGNIENLKKYIMNLGEK